ncbi:MAG: hypothetical protein AB8D52_05930, partial [Gammaproteobacteria bacterium]
MLNTTCCLRSLLLFVVAFLSACNSPAILQPEKTQALLPPNQFEIFFHTDRAPDRDEQKAFSGERGDRYYGVTYVGIPADH